MTTPQEVRDLVATSGDRWETLEVEGRTWQDRLAAREAASAMRRDRGAISTVRTQRGTAALPQGQREQTWHLWRGGEVLVRSEYLIGRELVTVVGQGPRWWRWSPTLGPTSGGGVGRPVRLMLGPPGILLSTNEVLEQVAFSSVRETTVALRPALSFRATPNATRPKGRAALRDAGSGADEYEIAVDAERGLLLSLTALREGKPFNVFETVRVTYDQKLAPNLFAPESSAPGRFVQARAAQHLSTEGIAERVDFTLLAPDPSPSPVAPHVSVADGDRRGLGPLQVVLAYVVVDPALGRGQLRITEAKSPLLRAVHDEWTPLGDLDICEERHGRVQRRRVRGERLGVHVEVESAVLPLAQLLQIFESLVALPEDQRPTEGE